MQCISKVRDFLEFVDEGEWLFVVCCLWVVNVYFVVLYDYIFGVIFYKQ